MHTHTVVNTHSHTHTAVNTHTHIAVNTHREHTPRAAGGLVLVQGSHLSRGIEGGESAGYSHLQSLRLEPATFRLQVQLSPNVCKLINELFIFISSYSHCLHDL